jgi:hypothetical protein
MYHIAFPPRTNRESFIYLGEIIDLDDNPVDLTGCSIVFQISDKFGCQYLRASTDDGNITIIGVGTFRVAFTRDQMKTLCPGTYITGLALTNADDTQTVQLAVGPLPIIDGIVP